ncbi:hypothetical protein RGR602_PC02156 (plasmid) [Rhizobium gallicum bv. gallicum R602sp]|uniref:Uncharacterized protein n=1 Tax=Rhizobium gallicum bv. gallicum R602sp TaxID=1041138 RepID=A0A0B4XGH1_9HYPH|nr:hypothetical protein RGR602_PC02156 [Rhizobium gallicum bv. gallicum R602sp]
MTDKRHAIGMPAEGEKSCFPKAARCRFHLVNDTGSRVVVLDGHARNSGAARIRSRTCSNAAAKSLADGCRDALAGGGALHAHAI